jgi:hypothetical protein
MSQLDWPVTKKNETVEAPEIIKRFYFEVCSSNPWALGPPIKMKGGQDLPKHIE